MTVTMRCERFGVSERKASLAVGQNAQPNEPVVDPDEERLPACLRAFAKNRPRWGWRRATDHARTDGSVVNRKRVQRLWREEGLRVAGNDFQSDQTMDGRPLKLLNVIDEYTREWSAIRVERSLNADDVVDCLDRIAMVRGYPVYLRMDNGPEFVAAAVRDWCRFNRTHTMFIEPGSPWQNPWIESFNARVRAELLNIEQFDSLLEAKVLTEDWRIDYNNLRPHRSLGRKTPTDYAQTWTNKHKQVS
jgi:putative transposase